MFLFCFLQSGKGQLMEWSMLPACPSFVYFFFLLTPVSFFNLFFKGYINGQIEKNYVCVYVCFALCLCIKFLFCGFDLRKGLYKFDLSEVTIWTGH